VVTLAPVRLVRLRVRAGQYLRRADRCAQCFQMIHENRPRAAGIRTVSVIAAYTRKAQEPNAAASDAGAPSGSRTRSTHSPATSRLAPPSTSAYIGWPWKNHFSNTPSTLAASSCGITTKKLKMPMYTPIFSAGRLSDSNAYGSERIDAHAKPTPAIGNSSQSGLRISKKDTSPAPPSHRLTR